MELDFRESLCIKVEEKIMSKPKTGSPISGMLGPEACETLVVRDKRNQDSGPPISWGQGKEWKREGGSR